MVCPDHAVVVAGLLVALVVRGAVIVLVVAGVVVLPDGVVTWMLQMADFFRASMT